jgi:acetyl-CoA synthetase
VVLQWPSSVWSEFIEFQELHMTVSHIETAGVQQGEGLKAFLAARDFLFQQREDYETAYRDFCWPQLDKFNWALDYFDNFACGNNKTALWIVDERGSEMKLSFAEMSRRSNQVANFLRQQGVRRGDRLIVQLPNLVAIWEIMLAALKLGAVVIPAATLLTVSDLRDRLDRGKARHVITLPGLTEKFATLAGDYTRMVVGGEAEGWVPYERAYDQSPDFTPDGETKATDPFMLYFTSGTTALLTRAIQLAISPLCTGLASGPMMST